MIRDLIAGFLRPKAIFPMPKGTAPDAFGNWGMFGFLQNANNYAESLSSVASVASGLVLTPAQLLNGVVQLNAGAGAAFNVTLPGTGAIIAALGNTTPLDGSYSERWTFINNSGFTATLIAGDGGTNIIGTGSVLASNVARTYIAQVLGSASINVNPAGALLI